MRRVAVTGATGFLGGHLVEELLERGAGVRAVVRTPEKARWLENLGAGVRQADVLDEDALVDAFTGCDAIIANAALGSWQGDLEAMHRVNVDGLRHTLQAAARAGCRRVVVVSSVAVYRSRPWRPISEEGPGTDPDRRRLALRDLTTDWRYAMTKTRGEHLAWSLAESLDLELTTVRPGPVYGPRDPKASARLTGWMGRRLLVLPTAGIPFVHVDDVCRATVTALERPDAIGHAYNLAGPPVSPVRIARTLKALGAGSPWIIPVPTPIHVAFDCSAAARDLDFVARPLERGLADLVG